jgi:phi13 family phage major tail protein
MADTPVTSPVTGEIVGCDNLYAAKVIADTADAYTAETPFYLAPLGEFKHDPKVSADTSYYDNQPFATYYSEAGETTLTVSGLAEKIKAMLTGKDYDNTKGLVFDSGDLSDVPDYAIGTRISVGTGSTAKYVYFWFLKGTFQLGATDAKSKGEKVDAQGSELTFVPVNTIHKFTVPGKATGSTVKKSQKRVIGDTADENFTEAMQEKWFDQVVTPETTFSEALGNLTVTSAEGAETGDTKITVTPTKATGNSYRYQTAATVSLPAYDADCSTMEAWDGTADIAATTGNQILIVECTSDNRARAAGIATVTSKA